MIEVYKVPTVVTLNKYATDTPNEIELVKKEVSQYANLVENNVWAEGGKGALELADEVLAKCNEPNDSFEFAYELTDSPKEKIEKVVKKIYGGKGVVFSEKAQQKLEIIDNLKLGDYPVIIAKTQFSLSDDKSKLGAPTDFEVNVRDIEIKTGAKFLVAICGDMMLMPGLSKRPASVGMTIDSDGNIDGLY